jgi:hypothetical protein
MSDNLRHLYLAHLSRDCNKPEIAFSVVQQRMQRSNATHVRVEVTQQAARRALRSVLVKAHVCSDRSDASFQ